MPAGTAVAALAAVAAGLLWQPCGARVVVVGDIHGDLRTARDILTKAQLIAEDGTWAAAPGTTLVQLGDIVDRGPDSHGVMDMFMDMRAQAARAGSAVVNLVGNHEALNVDNEWSFVHPAEIHAFGGVAGRLEQYSPRGRYGAFIRQNPIIHAIGSTVFCHAGLMPEFAALGIEELNRRAAQALVHGAGLWGVEPLFSEDGPVWTRSIVWPAQQGRCGNVTATLRRLSEREGRPFTRMVVGHTIQEDGRMSFLCDGQLVAADVGLSRFYSPGYVTYLEILNEGDEEKITLRQVQHTKPARAPQEPVAGVRSEPPITRPRREVVGGPAEGTTAANASTRVVFPAKLNLPQGYILTEADYHVPHAGASLAPRIRAAWHDAARRSPQTRNYMLCAAVVLFGVVVGTSYRGRAGGRRRGVEVAAVITLVMTFLVFSRG